MSVSIAPAASPPSPLRFALGPPESESRGRITLKYSGNHTASYVPFAIFDIQGRAANLRKPVEELIRFPQVTSELIKRLKEDIDNHVEMRLQLFCQQLLLIYKSGLVHKSRATDQQVGKGSLDYHAAHSSTLPSISSWDEVGGYILGKGSYFYDTWNGTVLLPKVVNAIDSELDRYNRKMNVNTALRPLALVILNEVSKTEGVTDPQIGLGEFIQAFLFLIGKAKEVRLEKLVDAPRGKERLEQELFVLECYEKVATSYLAKLKKGDELIKQLCFMPSMLQVNDLFYKKIQGEMLQRLAADLSILPLIQQVAAMSSKLPRAISLVLQQAPAAMSSKLPRAISLVPQQAPAAMSSKLPRAISLVPQQAPASKVHFDDDEKEPDPGILQEEQNRQGIQQSVDVSVPLTGQAAKYKNLCSVSDRVKVLVAQYFANTNETIFRQDLRELPNIKTSRTLHKFSLSEGIKEIREEVLQIIRGKYSVSEPQKMGQILLHLLQELMPVPELPPDL